MGKYQTLREGLKAAAEFLAPTKLDELKTRVQALAEKL
jgi:transglutaminase-like putative cysteine protease